MKPKVLLKTIALLAGSAFLKYYLSKTPLNSESKILAMVSVLAIVVFGGLIIYQIAKYIEDITTVLKAKTGLAGGLLQAVGTAFPDMALGITAAVISLSFVGNNELKAVQYAIVAASTTFGSNFYNIAHASWCIYRQNQANRQDRSIKMFPLVGGGVVSPLRLHNIKPKVVEINTAISVLVALTLLTTMVVIGMVFFGSVVPPAGISGDLYQLKWYVGIIMVALVLMVLFIFRKNTGSHQDDDTNDFTKANNLVLWLVLVVSGIIILFTAEAMIEAVIRFSELTHLPTVVSGLIAGLIGCLGEMMVIHNFTVNPKGKIGDAVVGVAMDNIMTLLGASVVAIIGGIFLGGSALLVIFTVILCLNTVLIWQVSKLKDQYLDPTNQE